MPSRSRRRTSPRREAYDVVLARAVAPMPVLLELAIPFLRVGGRAPRDQGRALRGRASRRGSRARVAPRGSRRHRADRDRHDCRRREEGEDAASLSAEGWATRRSTRSDGDAPSGRSAAYVRRSAGPGSAATGSRPTFAGALAARPNGTPPSGRVISVVCERPFDGCQAFARSRSKKPWKVSGSGWPKSIRATVERSRASRTTMSVRSRFASYPCARR